MPKYKPLYTLYKGLKESEYDVPNSYVSFQKTLTQAGDAGAKSRRGLYQSLKESNYDVPDTYENFYKNLFVPVNSTTSRALKIGENPNTPAVNRYHQKLFDSVDPNKSRASELTHRAVSQAKRAMNNVRKPVTAKVVDKKGKPTGEEFAITPAKTVEDLDREYAQETTKNWENELHDQMADADKDAAKISDMFKSFIGSTEEVGSVWGNITRGGGIAGTPHSVTTNNGILENTEARQILAAGEYNRKRKELLRLEKDSRNGVIFDNHSFFRGMYDAAKDTGFLTSGVSNLINAGSLFATNQDLDNGIHTEAGDMLMQQAVKNSNAQSQYGDNQGWMYTGGVITTNMVPFIVQIASAGFSKGLSTSIGKVVQGAASKVALGTMKKAAGFASADLAKNIGKVTGLTTKAFGKAIQYGIVGAAQANTVGLGNVANDVINRYTGQVYQDEQGNYKFGTFDSDGKLVHEGGEDFLTALVKGEAAQTIEFATELAGGGIDAVGTALKNFVTKGGKKIIAKYNMENVSKVIDFLLNNKVSKNVRYLKAGADRTLGKVEVNSIVGESLEEELGIIANTAFTGDNKISDLWDEKQQSQIWGGMLLSIGLMKGAVAPFHAYNAKQYYSYKHKLNKADVNLSQLLGKEKWEELRNQIDATTNEDMPEMVNKINRDVALGKNRQPVREYIQNLLIMRGYDIGNMLAAKKAVEDKGEGVSVKNMEKNQAYQQGRDAYGYDTHEIQLDQEDKQKSLAQLLGISEQQLVSMSDEELEELSGRDDNIDRAIYDYQLSTARYEGVVDNARDQIDLEVQRAAQAVDMYTDKSRNTIRNATIKASDGAEDYGVYIISGNIATHEDGSIDVSNSDDMILYYDPTTNTVEHADALMFAELGSEENADEVRSQAMADAKEKAIKKTTGIIDGVVEVGTQFKTVDADGTEHTYEVLADNGDGTAMITIDGNIPTELVNGENVNIPVSFEELQKMKDEADQQRLQAAKAQLEQMEKERAEQKMQSQTTQSENPAQKDNIQSAPIEDNIDYSDIIREDGKVQMVDVSDKDGNNLFPDAKDVFYIQGNKMRTKFAYIDANGELKTQSFPTGLVKVKTRGEVSVDDYKKYRATILSAESSAMPETSKIEDNSGENRGEIEVETPTIEDAEPIGTGAFGNIYNQFKGKVNEAFNFLLSHKSGDLLGVFHRDDVGDIDLVWGNEKIGLAHILGKHVGEGKDFETPDDAIAIIENVINSGRIFQNNENRYTLMLDGVGVGIRKSFDGEKKNWIVTAVDFNRSQEEKGIVTNPTSTSHGVTESESTAALNDPNDKDINNSSNSNENNESLTFEDGTPIPVDANGETDLSQTDAAHAAEWYDNNLGEDTNDWLNGEIKKAKKVLEQAKNKKLAGTKPSELVASKKEKEAAIADAQAHYDSAIAIRDAYNERQLAKEENTPEGRKSLIEKARRKFARLKNSEEWSEQPGDLWNETVGKLLHRLYDATGIDVFNDTPNTVYEYVASNVGPYSLNYEGNDNSKGVQQETGLSRSDFAKLGWLAAEGKGMTIDAKVHRLWENRPSNLESADTQEIRNALISLITSGQTAFQARDYILNQRIELAESALEEQLRQEEDAAEAQRAKEEEEKKKAELEKKKAEEEKTNENKTAPELSHEQQKAMEEGEKLGFPAFDKEGELINQNVIELANWAKKQGLEIDPTSKLNSYADLYVMCKDGFGVSTLVPDVGENINQVFYFPDNVQGEQLLKLQEEFNVGRDLKHSADMNSELTEGAMFYDGDTAREFRDFVNKKVNEESKDIEVPEDATDENPLGLQLSEDKVPFEIEGGKSGETYNINDDEDRQRLINDNKVDDKDILVIDMPKHVHKAIKELCKKMGLKVQFLYMGARSNGWIENGTMYLALDTEKATQFVFGHEMTHAIKQKNPEAYKELVKVAMAVTTRKKFEEDLAKVYQNYHGISGYNNVDDYVEEVVADNLGKFINDFDLAQKFSLRLNHPVLATILHAIQKIKSLLYGDFYKSVDALERIVEKAYVKTAKGQVTNSETGEDISFSLRQKPEPKKKGVGYKVFVLKDGKLYPPMVANPDGAATPVGVWLDADAAPIAGESKTGRPQVKQGGKGTQGGSGKLAYRPGWHLGVVPYAIQFNRKDADGNKTLFPKNFVFADVEYAADVDYQEEARQEGINPSGKYQHSLAGLKHLPTDGYYMYRTNPNPETDPWVITGAMKVNRILTRAEQAELVKNAGREPQQIQEGDIVTDDVVNSINQEIADAPKFSLKVYHGSGADFTEFDFDHMGEGAGSQVFGWGGYVTSSKKIGKSYAKIGQMSAEDRHRHASSEDTPIEAAVGSILGQEIYNERAKTFEQKKAQAIENAENSIASYSDMLKNSNELDKKSKKFLEKSIERYKKELEVLRALTEEQYKEEYIKQGRAKNLYEVDIPDDNGSNYLDWENPLNEEQINAIRDALAKNGVDVSSWENRGFKLDLPFKDVYAAVLPMMMRCEPKEVSKFLSSLGFTGIKYPAGTIQGGAEEGDTNYVIFKPEDMKITQHTKFSLRLKAAIEETETNPSDAQKESGNYKKGHIKFGGYDYTIENPKGSVRSGKDADGKEWKVTMHDTYGYIRGKFGKDGDHLDMFINDKADLDNWNGDVFVVDQVNPDGSFDEHKVMYGYDSMDDAEKAYLANYSKGWQGLGNITGASKAEFDKWLDTSNRKLKPFADYAKVKFSQAQSVSEPRYSLKDIKPVGVGAFGNIYNQFRGNAKAAIEFLKKVRGGEAVGALHHKDIGDIDLVWGKEGTGHSDGYGLSKLVKYHPEVLDNLQEILNDMRVVSSSKNRVNLESETHKAGVRLTWDGERKSWLLTAFKKETSASDKRTDTAATSLEGDTALSQTEGSAAKIDNSSETTKKNGEKFSLKDEKTLAGVHNITEEKLRKALKLGGFANPSLAVIDTNKSGHNNFGEISFIAPSALLDKRTGKTGGTWITDAYTQRYPSVERQMSEKGSQKFEDWVDSLEYPSAAKAEIKRQTKDVLEDNGVPAWELMYLKEKGIDIKAYDSNVDYRWKEIINDHPTSEDILSSMQNDPELKEKVTSLAKHAIIYPTWEKVSLEVRRKMYKETGVKASPINPQVRKQTKEIFERDYKSTLLNKDGSPRKKDVKKVVEDIVKEHNDTKKYDFYLSKVKASNYVNKNGLYDDYIRWQENKLDEFGTKNRIFRGYTRDGSRKYVPETLENVSKAMREEADGQTNGSEYTSFGSFIAKLASRVDSTDEMRANKDKLSSNKDKEEFYEKWSEVYYDLAKFLYNDVFYGEQRLHDIVLQSDPKKYAKKEYGITLTPTFMKKLDALKNAVQTELKSAYFETKYNRPLRLNEFAAVVVPDNLGEDVRKGIENAGLPMYDYDPNKEGDRSRAFNEAISSSDNIRFSLRGSTPYDKQMEEWKKKNHLEKDATPMKKPVMKEGENIFDYANRMVEWTRNQNLWKTAPKQTGFQEALDKWKADNGIAPGAYPPVHPIYEDFQDSDDYNQAVAEYRKEKEVWKTAPKPKDFDLSVDLDDMNKQLRNIRRAVLNQKNYDQRTVKAVSDLVRKMLNIGWGDGLSRGKVGNLLSAAKNATGANDVKKYLDKVIGILAENYLNRLSTAYDNLINTKGARADQSGVIKMGSLDAKGQAFMSEYKKAINMDDSSLNTYIANIEEDSAKNEDNVEMNDYRLAGIQAAIMYKQQIGGNDADISELKRQIGELKNKKDATKVDKDLLKSLEKKLFENKFDRITMYENLLNNIQRMVKESKGRAKEFRDKITEHKNEILHRANLDLEGVDSTYYDTTTAKKKFVNNDLQRAVFSSTYTFEQFLKFFGKHSANGEGRLYNYFHKLNQDALDEEQLYNEMNRNALDEKTKELFGKEKFMKLVGIDGKGMKEMDIEVTDYSNKKTGKRTIHLKQGQMLYIYLVNKETDGEMKLRAMGITEEDVAAIEENLDPRVKAMGVWLQDEYLPECQRRYQATHTKYFGAPMKEVENYFPLAINNRARNVKEDVNQDSDAMSQLAGTSTGAIVTRRVNVIPLDIENADAFEVAFNHLQEMEEWSAMLPFRQDINTLLSYTHFRNQVQNMSSVAYGSGKTLWDEFRQTAQIAAGTYKPKVNAGMMDSRIAAAMGGIAVAKISGRLWTAIKQSQSATVFLPECDFTRFVKNGVNPYGSWKWAMENIPDFRKRVENMTYGDVKLRQYLDELEKWHDWTKTISKIGMAPNILVDGITCAVGARSVYETEVNRLTKLGYPKDKADEKAYYKAVAAYNKTQQSSGGIYLSPMQVDRTYVSAALSLFKNANYAYGRMQIEACRGLARTYDFWGGKHKTTLIESMTRQIMGEDGLNENTARTIAKATYNRTFRQSIGRLINFATLVPVSWALYKVLPYLLTGDDDDKKKDMIEEAVLKGFATSLSDNYVIPFASNILNAGLKVENGKPTFDPEVFRYQNLYINPATSDLANIYSMIGNQKWYSVANKLGMLGVQSLIGFNPETVGALYQAFAEADYDNGNTAKEWQIGILKAISAPEESIRELYMDELGLKSGDIKKIPLVELEKRYAERQINRDNLLSQIGMDAETFNGYVNKYQKSFEKKIKDKMNKWDEYDKKKANEFFDTTSDPKLKDMIEKKRVKDANAAADDQITKEGLNQEKKGKEPSEVAYDAVKMSIDVAEDNAISTYNKVLNKRYAALNDEYNEQTDATKYIFMSKHPNFKAYKELESEYTNYGKKIKELKEKLVSADGYDAKQTILKQIRAEREKFSELQSKVR